MSERAQRNIEWARVELSAVRSYCQVGLYDRALQHLNRADAFLVCAEQSVRAESRIVNTCRDLAASQYGEATEVVEEMLGM